MVVSADRPSMISFATGTTDRPKGLSIPAVYSIDSFHYSQRIRSWSYTSFVDEQHQSHFLANFWWSKSEIIPTNGTPAFFFFAWKQFQEGWVNSLSGYLLFWHEMAQYFRDNISTHPSEIQASKVPSSLTWSEHCRRYSFKLLEGTAPPAIVRSWWSNWGWSNSCDPPRYISYHRCRYALAWQVFNVAVSSLSITVDSI